ncbi:MAG: TorF family putative porin [Betaproteobacteria bacterium]
MRALHRFCGAALGFIANIAQAQVTGQVSLLSDYRFRGESLSDEQPALQAGINYDHSSGLFIGALASNVRVGLGTTGLGAQFYGGYAHALGKRASWDVGLVTYVYPSSQRATEYNYTEAFVGAATDELSARVYYADDYFGAGARAAYVEGNLSHPLNERVALIAHIGYLNIGRVTAYPTSAQRSDQLDFKAGVGIGVAGFNLELSVVGTDAPRDRCVVGTVRCGTAGLVSLSRTF